MPSTATSILDGLSTSVAVKAPCQAVGTSNVTLSGLQTINGYTTEEGDRVLLIGQTDGTENGIYAASTGTWSRTKDFDGNRDVVKGTLVVSNDVDSNIYYRVTSDDPIVIGSSDIDFEIISGTLTRSIIGHLLYPQTTEEAAAGVTPLNYFYPAYTRGRYSTWADWTLACNQAEAEGLLEKNYTITANISLPKKCNFAGFRISGAFYTSHDLYWSGWVKGWHADQPRIRGCYYCEYTGIDTGSIVDGTLTVTGGNGSSNPGTFWCKIGIQAVVNLVIDASFFDVNQNLFTGGVARYVHLTGGTGGTGGIHANTFKNIDASNNSLPASGFVQDDEKRYVNYIENCYYEGGSDIQGNFHVVGFQGDNSSPPRTDRFTNILNAVGINQKNNKDFLSLSTRNLVRGGNWDWLDTNGKPLGLSTTNSTGVSVVVDTTEPCGIGKRYQSGFSGTFSSFNITIQPTGSDRFGAVIFYKSTDAFVAITSDDGSGAQSINVTPVTVDSTNNWKMLRVSGSASKTATTSLKLYAYTGVGGAAKTISIGGIFASAERVVIPPQKNDDHASGLYTPTATNVSNLSALSVTACQYARVGNTYVISGEVGVTPTANATATSFGLSLPETLITAFAASQRCCGVMAASTVVEVGRVIADSANQRMAFNFISATTAAHFVTFTVVLSLAT
jgi:hypothetical protein